MRPPGDDTKPAALAYHRSPDQDAARIPRHKVIVVGAGPVGLTMAIDLAFRGVPVVLLDDADRIGEGSRAICFSKRTLEIFDRLGVAAPMVEKGVTWKIGKVFHKDREVYSFDLLPESGHRMPAFINLQQYYVERFLVEKAAKLPEIDLRWRNRVVDYEALNDGARIRIDTPDGAYALEADWLVAADGARSTLRHLMGLDFVGEAFEDRFLIADVKMHGDFPPERWFWFEPPFHDGQSALLHSQPDDVWRIDLQLGAKADPELEKLPEHVIPRIERMLGHAKFALEWVSIYTFQCRRLARFVHGRTIFVGDAAHQVSPFGARGANSGIQDAENLAWKLAAVLTGAADEGLIASYDIERGAAADENIRHSTRSTDFIAPRGAPERRFRDAVLALARTAPFARRMINSGRLSTPCTFDSPLTTPDGDAWAGSARLGAPLPDVPLETRDGQAAHLLERLPSSFTLIHVGDARPPVPEGVTLLTIGARGDLVDRRGLFAERYDASSGATYLVRPDQHLSARWRAFDVEAVAAAHIRALGH